MLMCVIHIKRKGGHFTHYMVAGSCEHKGIVTQWDMHTSKAYPSSFLFPAQGRRKHFWGEATNMEDSDRVIIRVMVVSRDPQQLNMGTEQHSWSSYSWHYQRFITGRAVVCHLWAEISANRCNLGSSSDPCQWMSSILSEDQQGLLMHKSRKVQHKIFSY
jgi:hypothetical protein